MWINLPDGLIIQIVLVSTTIMEDPGIKVKAYLTVGQVVLTI